MDGVVVARLPCANSVPCACRGVPATFRPTEPLCCAPSQQRKAIHACGHTHGMDGFNQRLLISLFTITVCTWITTKYNALRYPTHGIMYFYVVTQDKHTLRFPEQRNHACTHHPRSKHRRIVTLRYPWLRSTPSSLFFCKAYLLLLQSILFHFFKAYFFTFSHHTFILSHLILSYHILFITAYISNSSQHTFDVSQHRFYLHSILLFSKGIGFFFTAYILNLSQHPFISHHTFFSS